MTNFIEKSVQFGGLECFLLISNPISGGFKKFDFPGFKTFSNGNYVALSNVGDLNPLEGLFLGTDIGQAGVVSGPFSPSQGSEPDVTGVGRCCKIQCNGNGYTISADPFGQECVFWGCIDGVSFVSNHLLLIAEFFKANGRKLSVNFGATYLQSFTDSSIAMHSVVRRTVFEGFSYLLPNQILHLGPSGKAEIEDIPRNRDPITFEEYDDALAKCAEQMTGKLATVAKQFDAPVVRLTAGLDSRCSFALALATFDADRLRRFTYPRNPVDSFGSHFLGTACGVAAIDEFQISEQTCDQITSSLQMELVANFGVNHSIQVRGPSLSDCLPNGLLLCGGGGEVHRYAFEERFRKVLGFTDPFSPGAARELFDFQYSGALADFSVQEMKDQLIEEISLLPGNSLLEKMENHYLSHKNRFHFSGSAKGISGSERYNVMPLLDSDLWAISSRVAPSLMKSGIVLKDLVEKLVPSLSSTPYNGELAKKFGIESSFRERGAVVSKYDMRFPSAAVEANERTNAIYDEVLYALTEDAILILRQSGMFADIVEYGARRLSWMKTLSGHNFRRAWCSRLINLAKITAYV